MAANDLFLNTMGCRREEVVGQHHAMFVSQAELDGEEYREFWRELKAGRSYQAEFARLAKGGRRVWLQASYTPICAGRGQHPFKVIKYATDITATKEMAANAQGQLAAINKAQAVIEFDLTGTILTANQNFLDAVGYRLDEIRGQHHSIFVDKAERDAEAYARFWEKLARGEHDEGQYRRIGKNGRSIWIQASYNPIFDALGIQTKIVKYATDITASRQAAAAMECAVAETRSVILAARAKDLAQRIPSSSPPSCALDHLADAPRRWE